MSQRVEEYPKLTDRFEQVYIFSSFVLITGAYLDAWSHIHIPDLESFFTPSHGVLYTGGAMVSFLMVWTMFRNLRAGFPLTRSIPKGYLTGVFGFVILMVSGIGDMFWHTIFGIEQDLEAAFSITHLGIITGIVLIMLAPTMVQRNRGDTNIIPMVSYALTLLALNVISSWSHPLVKLYPTLNYTYPNIGYSLGILSMLLQTVFLMGILLPIFRDRILPVGSMTFIVTVDAVYLGFLNANYVFIAVYLFTGLLADLMYWQYKKGGNPVWFRVFSIFIPAILYSLYIIVLEIIDEVLWNAHIISGAIAFPAIVSGFIGIAMVKEG